MVKFSINMPGLIRFPPALFAVPSENWETTMGVAEYQRVARTAERLGFDALTVSEHIVVPPDLVPHMGAFFPDALTAMALVPLSLWFIYSMVRLVGGGVFRSRRLTLRFRSSGIRLYAFSFTSACVTPSP